MRSQKRRLLSERRKHEGADHRPRRGAGRGLPPLCGGVCPHAFHSGKRVQQRRRGENRSIWNERGDGGAGPSPSFVYAASRPGGPGDCGKGKRGRCGAGGFSDRGERGGKRSGSSADSARPSHLRGLSGGVEKSRKPAFSISLHQLHGLRAPLQHPGSHSL